MIENTERLPLIGAGLLVVIFLAALTYAATALNISVPTCVTSMAPFDQGAVIDHGNKHYEIHMVARMWTFDPAEIRLPPGADIDIYLSAADVTHGLYIEHTNVNLMAVPGTVNFAHVHFSQEGEFDLICHEYCGIGHHFMMGRFIIERAATV